jgi:CheY-like chemotaxis protein
MRIEPAADRHFEEPAMPSFRTEPPRILVMEKDAQVLDNLSAALAEANFQICRCFTEEEALELIGRQPPDAVISDVVLNRLSVGEFCERIKQQPGMKDVPVMFLSPAQVPDIIRRHDVHGGTYYLRKRCEPRVLVQLLEQVMDLAPVTH